MKKIACSLGCLVLAACGTAGGGVDAETVASADQALVDDNDGLDEAGGGSVDATDDDAMNTEESATGECALGGLRKKVIDRYDTDGDGKLDNGERQELQDDIDGHPLREARVHRARALHRVILHRLKWVYDANDDGTLDDSEKQTLKDDLEVRCANRKAQILERYDADGSGDLSDSERAVLREDRQERIQARHEELLAHFDANNDGRIDDGERAAVRDAAKERAQAKRAALKDRFDVDNNGKLNADERDAAREAIRARIRLETPDATEA